MVKHVLVSEAATFLSSIALLLYVTLLAANFNINNANFPPISCKHGTLFTHENSAVKESQLSFDLVNTSVFMYFKCSSWSHNGPQCHIYAHLGGKGDYS